VSGGARLERDADRRLAREQHRTERQNIVNTRQTITTRVQRLIAPKPWKAPDFTQPMVIDASELHPLGVIRGCAWFSHSLGDLEERTTVFAMRRVDVDGEVGEQDVAVPNGPVVQMLDPETGARSFRPFRVYAPGTYAELASGVTAAQRAAKPSRPVDALDGLILLQPRTPGSLPIRGAGPILARLGEKGFVVTLSADRLSLVASAEDGRPYPFGIAVLNATAPLLLAHLRGEPLACAVTVHKGKPATAATLSLGGTGWCGQCIVGG